MSTKTGTKAAEIVEEAPESVPTIEELQEQLRQAEDWRVALINNAQQHADMKSWCQDFDAIMVKCGLPKRRMSTTARFRLWLNVPPPKEASRDYYAWGASDAGKTAALDALEAGLALAREGDWSAFPEFAFYDTTDVRAPYTREDIADSPMRLLGNGKPQITRVKKGA